LLANTALIGLNHYVAVGESFLTPSDAVRIEIETYLMVDDSLLGEVWRLTREGLSDDEIRLSRGAASPNFIWNYRRHIDSLLRGTLSNGPAMLRNNSQIFNRVLKHASLSEEALHYLKEMLEEMERRIASSDEREQEESVAVEANKKIEGQGIIGIYVYSLMHYLRYPYDPNSGRTLLKVGRSDRDVIRRFREQTRTTALPEEPVLLRIYETGTQDPAETEKRIHAFLEAADHDRSSARTGGTEWFLTNLKFLDHIASTMNLNMTKSSLDLDN
jgi:hypothetical protein